MARNVTPGSTDRREATHRQMLQDPMYKVVPAIALPMIISQLISSFYNMADTYFVSQIGTAATAAVGINDSLLHFLDCVAMGFGAGCQSYVSRLLGAKKDQEANSVATTTLALGMLAGLLLTVIGYTFMSPLIDLLGATATSKQYSMDYATYILAAAPVTSAVMILGQILRAEGSTKFSMWGTVSGCIINVALDPLFINVFKMEVAGAALATAISKVISMIILLIPFFKRHTLIRLNPRYFSLKWESMKEVARMGIPTFLRMSMMSISSTITNNIAGRFGDFALAAMSVGNKSMRMLASMIMGFSQGFQPVAGYCWGAKRYDRTMEALSFTTLAGGAGAAIIGVVLFIAAPAIIGIFVSDGNTDTLRMGITVVRSQCVVLPMHMWVMLASGFFQALGKPINATILGLSRSLLALVPCVFILSALWGANGLAYSRAAADVVSFLIALPMFIVFFSQLKKQVAAEGGEMKFTLSFNSHKS